MSLMRGPALRNQRAAFRTRQMRRQSVADGNFEPALAVISFVPDPAKGVACEMAARRAAGRTTYLDSRRDVIRPRCVFAIFDDFWDSMSSPIGPGR